MHYTIKHSSSLIKCPDHISISANGHSNKPEDTPNSLKLELTPIGTGIYPDRIMFKSPYDIRVVDVEISAQCLGQTFNLDFKTMARVPVTQTIPLVNSSDKPMVIAAKVRSGVCECLCFASQVVTSAQDQWRTWVCCELIRSELLGAVLGNPQAHPPVYVCRVYACRAYTGPRALQLCTGAPAAIATICTDLYIFSCRSQ